MTKTGSLHRVGVGGPARKFVWRSGAQQLPTQGSPNLVEVAATLQRRSQRSKIPREVFSKNILQRYRLPEPRIVHSALLSAKL